MAVGNVRLNAKIEDSQVLDRVLLWVKATDDAKALAFMNVSANLVQSWAQGGKGEVVASDEISIQA